MASDPKNPQAGDFSIDASEVQAFAQEIDDAQGLRTEHPGCEEAIEEIATNQPGWGAKAGVASTDVDQINECTQEIETCDKYLVATRKLDKLLTNTRAVAVHKRELLMNLVAETVDRHGKLPGNETVVAKYGKTRAYRSAIASKGAKTRKRNAKAEAAEQGEGSTTATAPTTATSSAAPTANGSNGSSTTH